MYSPSSITNRLALKQSKQAHTELGFLMQYLWVNMKWYFVQNANVALKWQRHWNSKCAVLAMFSLDWMLHKLAQHWICHLSCLQRFYLVWGLVPCVLWLPKLVSGGIIVVWLKRVVMCVLKRSDWTPSYCRVRLRTTACTLLVLHAVAVQILAHLYPSAQCYCQLLSINASRGLRPIVDDRTFSDFWVAGCNLEGRGQPVCCLYSPKLSVSWILNFQFLFNLLAVSSNDVDNGHSGSVAIHRDRFTG